MIKDIPEADRKHFYERILPATAVMGFLGLAHMIGIVPEDAINTFGHFFKPNLFFYGGVVIGLIKNVLLISKTLENLRESHSIVPGDLSPQTIDDQVKKIVWQLTCVDARRTDKGGLAVPGGPGISGVAARDTAMSIAVEHFIGGQPYGEAVVGYLLANNLITFIKTHWDIASELFKIVESDVVRNHPNYKMRVVMKNHLDGCGAQGFTDEKLFVLKFLLRKLRCEDLLSIPNWAAGYIWVNTVLALFTKAISGGKLELVAPPLVFSPMKKTH